MKVSTEDLENRRIALNIEAEASELDKSLDQAYHHLVREVSIPGFRKGKAPRVILEQQIGKGALLQEALGHLVPQLYKEAIQSKNLEPIAEPELEITQSEPLVFKAIVSLKPEVKLGDYHNIKLEAGVSPTNSNKPATCSSRSTNVPIPCTTSGSTTVSYTVRRGLIDS